MDDILHTTPLHAEHLALLAKMCPFAGYDMPVNYGDGILKEHLWTRDKAGLFDVSHMGQCFIVPEDGQFETAARALESLIPLDILGMKPGTQRYGVLLNPDGGILDDLMIYRCTTRDGSLYCVVNAGRKEQDFAHFQAHLPAGTHLKRADDLALLALQGPLAEAVLSAFIPAVTDLAFMTCMEASIQGRTYHIARAGYTGEDGFEISIAAADSVFLWRLLLSDERVHPIGLGARDSLRLEAGLCLYGHDIDETTSPVEASLVWSMQKRRREEGGFPGYERIARELEHGPKRQRVGLLLEGRAPAREGAVILANGEEIGVLTSGGFGPSVNIPVAMGYVKSEFASPGSKLDVQVRGKNLPATIVSLPFVPHQYKRR
jgi:aminomethyltransferase